MFKDAKEKNFFYYVAKAIAEDIAIQLDEIEELDGHFEVDFSQITLDHERRCIAIDTDYIDEDDGKRYVLHEDVNMYKARLDFLPKVFYMWLDCFAKDFEHGVNFTGNV